MGCATLVCAILVVRAKAFQTPFGESGLRNLAQELNSFNSRDVSNPFRGKWAAQLRTPLFVKLSLSVSNPFRGKWAAQPYPFLDTVIRASARGKLPEIGNGLHNTLSGCYFFVTFAAEILLSEACKPRGYWFFRHLAAFAPAIPRDACFWG